MPRIKPDTIVYSNLTEAYLNYDRIPQNITIPADNIADGFSNTYTTVIPYTRNNTRADVYLEGNNMRVPANAGYRISTQLPTYTVYQYTSSETVNVKISYSSTAITVSLVVANNTGGPITLISQTIQASAVMYDAPF
jgi:hypothetical protein